MSYIQIPRWEEFQHYKGVERPVWIRNYTRLLHDDAYLGLTTHQRGILHGIWLAHAASGGQVGARREQVQSRLGARLYQRDLEALNHAGFIVLPSRVALEQRREEKRNVISIRGGQPVDNSAPPRKSHDPRVRRSDGTSRYTGCRQTRGQGGFGHVYDPLGIDRPPKDWAYPLPTNAEILLALQMRRTA